LGARNAKTGGRRRPVFGANATPLSCPRAISDPAPWGIRPNFGNFRKNFPKFGGTKTGRVSWSERPVRWPNKKYRPTEDWTVGVLLGSASKSDEGFAPQKIPNSKFQKRDFCVFRQLWRLAGAKPEVVRGRALLGYWRGPSPTKARKNLVCPGPGSPPGIFGTRVPKYRYQTSPPYISKTARRILDFKNSPDRGRSPISGFVPETGSDGAFAPHKIPKLVKNGSFSNFQKIADRK